MELFAFKSLLKASSKNLETTALALPKRKPKEITGVLPIEQKNFVIGIDDCICTIKSRKQKEALSTRDVLSAEVVPGAIEWVNSRFEEGNIISFLTTRKEKLRGPTERWLKDNGFKYHSLVMNKPVADQYHYIDDRHVQATTFRGKFAPLVRKEHTIQVFS